MKNNQEYIKTNTTFVISGHNTRYLTALACESLHLNGNIPKEQIVYFDDFSTDGSREEMESRGFHVITWTKEFFEAFYSIEELRDDLAVRVGQIVSCILHQIDTEYVCFFDNDLIHTGDTPSWMLDLTGENEWSICGALQEWENSPALTRLLHTALWCNRTVLAQTDCLGESLDAVYSLYKTLGGAAFDEVYDTGSIFFKQAEERTLDMVSFDLVDPDFPALHCVMTSATMRDDVNCFNDYDEFQEIFLENINSDASLAVCRAADINSIDIIQNYFDNHRKSPLCENIEEARNIITDNSNF